MAKRIEAWLPRAQRMAREVPSKDTRNNYARDLGQFLAFVRAEPVALGPCSRAAGMVTATSRGVG